MTLEEYAVEKIKELENRKVELEVALKSKEAEYKSANTSIRKLREENNIMKEMIGFLSTSDSSTNLNQGGTIYMYLHDPWEKNVDDSDEETKKRRKWFTFCKKVITEYKESHPKPEPEPEPEPELDLEEEKREGSDPF